MSLGRIVRCDGCGATYDDPNISYSEVKALRDSARNAGWEAEWAMDYCDDCKNETPQEMESIK